MAHTKSFFLSDDSKRSLILRHVQLSLFCASIIIKTIQETLETILVRNKLHLENQNPALLNIHNFLVQVPRELHSIILNER